MFACSTRYAAPPDYNCRDVEGRFVQASGKDNILMILPLEIPRAESIKKLRDLLKGESKHSSPSIAMADVLYMMQRLSKIQKRSQPLILLRTSEATISFQL